MMVEIEKGMKFIREGELEKAQIILRRALKENPDQPKVLELSGDLSARLGRVDEAIARYERAVGGYNQHNNFAEAIVCLEKILRLKPDNGEAYFQLAQAYQNYGLVNEGINRILDLCMWAIENKKETLFVEGMKKIVELQAKNYPLRLAFAKVLFAINRNSEAEEELKRLKTEAAEAGQKDLVNEIDKLLPQTDGGEELDPKSRVELGNLLYEIGSKEEAITEFKQAVADLIEAGEVDEAEQILKRIIEIDPNDQEAIKQLNELKPGAKKIEEPAETETKEVTEKKEVVEEPSPLSEAPSEEVAPTSPESEKEEGVELFEDLKKEVEGFIPTAEEPSEPEPEETKEVTPVEGQIADIEFLLKETEAPAAPSFELAKVFDDFRSRITWTTDDPNKRVELAKKAFDAELYDVALNFVEKIREDKSTWPTSLEITCASLVKLGRYNEAIKIAGPSLLEDIPEEKKTELRYILASAYEGLGDFENAMREIERIMKDNPDYKDIKEHYQLMGGEIAVEKEPEEKPIPPSPAPPEISAEKEIVASSEVAPEISSHEIGPEIPPPVEPSPEVQTEPSRESFPEQGYPSIIEGAPKEKKIPETLSDKPPEEREGENIAFL